MSPFISTVDQILSILTILGQIFLAILLFLYFFKPPKSKILIVYFSKYSYLFAFVIALVATSGSLFYSEIARFTPCVLCWYQRILMYPQVILFGVSLWKDDKKVTDHTLVLSILGGFIALYHYLLQREILPQLPCSAVGFSVSCAELFTMNFGYITIPLMSLTAFAFISLLMLFQKKFEKNR